MISVNILIRGQIVCIYEILSLYFSRLFLLVDFGVVRGRKCAHARVTHSFYFTYNYRSCFARNKPFINLFIFSFFIQMKFLCFFISFFFGSLEFISSKSECICAFVSTKARNKNWHENIFFLGCFLNVNIKHVGFSSSKMVEKLFYTWINLIVCLLSWFIFLSLSLSHGVIAFHNVDAWFLPMPLWF